jgi:predicted acylesterase/phospholipase RssA
MRVPRKDITPFRLPLVVAARMSLSFPILFAAIPLYRLDYGHDEPNGTPTRQRMLFSDGGLSSNFPVHFFDALLPNRPTFGISLEDYDSRSPDRRVRLPVGAGQGMGLDSEAINSLPGFLLALIYAAKDWQDRLQSTLPGYRERIASIYLKPEEGGLNLTMAPGLIDQLVSLGERAAALMVGQPLNAADKSAFAFDEHRWRRYLIAFGRLEQTLEDTQKTWNGPGDFAEFIRLYEPTSYQKKDDPEWRKWRDDVFARFSAIMSLAAGWKGLALSSAPAARIPKPESELRITPKP